MQIRTALLNGHSHIIYNPYMGMTLCEKLVDVQRHYPTGHSQDICPVCKKKLVKLTEEFNYVYSVLLTNQGHIVQERNKAYLAHYNNDHKELISTELFDMMKMIGVLVGFKRHNGENPPVDFFIDPNYNKERV